MSTLNQARFAELHSVSRKTVTIWKARGWLVMQGSLVDVEASNARLDKYRDASDARATRGKKRPSSGNKVTGNKVTPSAQRDVAAGIDFLPGESVDDAAERLTAGAAVDLQMPVEEAKRIKEVYLALLNRLDYEQKSGALIELTLAQQIIFDAFRGQRDSWLNWPVRVGPVIAAELGIEATDRVVELLTAHVHQQISALGEVSSDFKAG